MYFTVLCSDVFVNSDVISGLMTCPVTCVCRVWRSKVSMATVSSVTVKKL